MEQNNNKEKNIYTRPDDAILRMQLTEDQYAVTQLNATEPPYFNAYWDEDGEGIYVDIVTGEPLFLSTDKFRSGGWPSFYRPIDRGSLIETEDNSLNETRIEVHSRIGGTHLGHVFPDGPIEHGGLRYCINSASIRFIPKNKLETEGYNKFLKYFKL